MRFLLFFLICGLAWPAFDYRSAKELYTEGQYQKAALVFHYVAINQEILKPYADYYAGECFYKMGDLEKALEIFSKVEGPYQKQAQVRRVEILARLAKQNLITSRDAYVYGESLFQLGQFEESIKWLTEANPQVSANILIGRALIIRGKYPAAISHLTKLPGAIPAYFTGVAYQRLSQPGSANSYYLRSVALDPHSEYAASCFYNLAKIAFEQKNSTLAARYINRLIKDYPESELVDDASWLLGRFYADNGNYFAAEEVFLNGYLQNYSGDQADALLYWAGKMSEKRGLKAEAKLIYAKVLQEYPLRYYGFRAAEQLQTTPVFFFSPLGLTTPQKYERLEMLAEQGAYDDMFSEINYLEPAGNNKYLYYRLAQSANRGGDYNRAIRAAVYLLRKAEKERSRYGSTKEVWQSAYPLGYTSEIEKSLWLYPKLDKYLVHALIREESLYDTKALSPANAYGLMQLIPTTGQAMADKVTLAEYKQERLHEPAVNIKLGMAYLHLLLEKFSGNRFLALAGYNAGPNAAARWQKKNSLVDLDEFIENIPYNETRNYVKRVMQSYRIYKLLYEGKL